MATRLFFLMSLLFISQGYSQEQIVKIDYDLYVNGFSMSTKNSELFIGDEYSLFVWNDTISRIEEEETEENQLKFSLEVTDSIGKMNYYTRNKDSIFTRSVGLEEVQILKEKRPAIEWELHPEIKTIGKLECNKASCSFRGRTYEVWYTPDIPIFEGPWKLHGLPGLVMEVKDKEGMLQIYFKKISHINKNLDRHINALESGKVISIEQYAEIQRNIGDELVKRMKLSFPRELNMSIDGVKQDHLEREFN